MSLETAQTVGILDPQLIHDIDVTEELDALRIGSNEEWIAFSVPKFRIKKLLRLKEQKKDVEFYEMLEAILVQHNGEVPVWLRKRK